MNTVTLQQKQVILYNGEPRLKVTHYRDTGLYEWATKKTAILTHSLLSEVDKFMKKNGYKYFIVEKLSTDDDAS